MLPDRLLSYDRTPDHRLVPRWLSARDDVWLRELLIGARAADGLAAGEADRRIVDVASERAFAHGISRRLVEGVWTVERRRWSTRIDAKIRPEKIRRVLFDLAAARDREDAVAVAARELQLDPAAILAGLFADRPDARLLVPPTMDASEQDLRERYNLVLAQSLLVRSSVVVATVRGHARRVVGQARLLRLMVDVTELADEALRVAISGPLALFHDTLKYGRALASWLPALLTTPEWRLSSRVVVAGEAFQLDLDPSAPLARTHALSAAFDSKLEERLDRDLRRKGVPWRVERESTVIRCGKALFFPDFTLVDATGRRVAVEIAGFWTPEYLESKRRMLTAADVPIVVCVDGRHGGALLAHGPNVIAFEKAVDVDALVTACEAALGTFRAPRCAAIAARHWLTVPVSMRMRAHAVRLGADEERWREDIVSDLVSDEGIRVGIERPEPPGTRLRAFLVGERFLVELTPDGSRNDALFGFRVLEPRGRSLTARHLPVTLALRAPGEHTPAADDVQPTLEKVRELARATFANG